MINRFIRKARWQAARLAVSRCSEGEPRVANSPVSEKLGAGWPCPGTGDVSGEGAKTPVLRRGHVRWAGATGSGTEWDLYSHGFADSPLPTPAIISSLSKPFAGGCPSPRKLPPRGSGAWPSLAHPRAVPRRLLVPNPGQSSDRVQS